VVGWLIVVGFGAFFSLFTTWLVKAEEKWIGTEKSSEWFNTAGRNIGTGLTSAVIVSQWTWAATLLQSSTVAMKYGISGPFWYAAGASIQVLLFAMVAIEIKRKVTIARLATSYLTNSILDFLIRPLMLTHSWRSSRVVGAESLTRSSCALDSQPTSSSLRCSSWVPDLSTIDSTM